MISSFSPINERHVFCFFLLFSAFRQMLHPKPRARCHSCPAYIHSELVNGLTAENLNVHNALHSCDDIGNDKVYIDQMVNTFVDAQSQIIQREIFLSCYNRTQCQSIVVLEHSSVNPLSTTSLLVQKLEELKEPKKTYQELQQDYDQEKMALVMQGLSVTGALLSSTFSLAANPNQEIKMTKKSRLFVPKRDKFAFAAYRYPKTIDIHSLRLLAIRFLANLCPNNS